MFLVSLTGFAAGTLCTLAYLPQALHSFRTKSVRDLSLLMLISLNVGLVLWVGYGFMIHSLPIILPNAVTFFLSAPLLLMKLRYRDSTEGRHARPAIGTGIFQFTLHGNSIACRVHQHRDREVGSKDPRAVSCELSI